jgi:hypothetical protein
MVIESFVAQQLEFVSMNLWPNQSPEPTGIAASAGPLVHHMRYTGKLAKFKARIPQHFHSEFAPYIVKE